MRRENHAHYSGILGGRGGCHRDKVEYLPSLYDFLQWVVCTLQGTKAYDGYSYNLPKASQTSLGIGPSCSVAARCGCSVPSSGETQPSQENAAIPIRFVPPTH